MIALLALWSAPANAWDVILNTERDYRSLFPELVPDEKDGHINEHATFGQENLEKVSPELYARYAEGSDDLLSVVDLNAWARDVGPRVAHGDDDDTPLAERDLPPLYMWSVLPDLGYSVGDWVNQLELCPSLPTDEVVQRPDLCHEYAGWLGAGLNSTHLGGLAIKTYGRHHQIAVARAADARALRELLKQGGQVKDLPDGSDFHADALREAEQLALIFELTGSHFLQDRWSMGHMFNRWGTPSYSALPVNPTTGNKELYEAQAVGLATGIIHGAGFKFGQPDPMTFPLESEGKAVTWSYSDPDGNDLWGKLQTNPGIGDALYLDLRDDRYQRNGNDFRLYVGNQARNVDTCVSAGMREVIAGFGKEGSGYGIDEVTLSEIDAYREHSKIAEVEGFDPTKQAVCTDAWATHSSLHEGARSYTGNKFRDVIVGVKHKLTGGPVVENPPYEPEATLETAFRIKGLAKKYEWEAMRWAERDPDGTTLARTGFPVRVGKDGSWFLPADGSAVPEYIEPVDFSTLPEGPLETGVDQSTMYGFFNKAHSEHWCGEAEGVLDELREALKTADYEGRQEDLGACVYLAGKLYKGTDPDYPDDGVRFEDMGLSLPWDGTVAQFGTDYEPICAYFDADLDEEDDDAVPYWMHPGYVSNPQYLDLETQLGAETLRNWCNSAPVLDWLDDDLLQLGFYVVGETPRGQEGNRNLALTGLNLGLQVGLAGAAGSVKTTDIDGNEVELGVYDPVLDAWHPAAWSDNGQVLNVQLPLSGGGFPSLGVPGDLPHVLKGLDPMLYPLSLTRPDDAAADPRFQNDGEALAGEAWIGANAIWTESDGLYADSGTRALAIPIDMPAWLQTGHEVLADGFYVKGADGTMTPLATGTQMQLGGWWDLSGDEPVWVSDPDKAGVLLERPNGFDSTVWNGTVHYFLAIH